MISREPGAPAMPTWKPPAAPVTQCLLWLNIAIFLLELACGDVAIRRFALWPLGHGFAAWQVVTSAFLHGSVLHLFLNLFGLRMFGREVEPAVGSGRFLFLYFLSAVTASATQLLVTALLGQAEPTLGASGAVFGVLGAFAIVFPHRVLVLLFPPIPLPARLFVILYATAELLAGVYGTDAGIAHFAHLGGLAGGLACIWRWRRSPSPLDQR
jgi:membrane associated rhomboid family serine protease